MENKLLEKNIERVLSMVGKDGRTVSCIFYTFESSPRPSTLLAPTPLSLLSHSPQSLSPSTQLSSPRYFSPPVHSTSLQQRPRHAILGNNNDISKTSLARRGLLEDTSRDDGHRCRVFIGKRPSLQSRGAAAGAAACCSNALNTTHSGYIYLLQYLRPHRFVLDTPMQEMTYLTGRTPTLAFLSWKDIYSLCSRYAAF